MKKTLYIIRGIPGTGKTSLARKLCPKWHPFKFEVAADDYPNRYLADGSLNPDITHSAAHKWCYKQVNQGMKKGLWAIAVPNTFTSIAYLQSYIDLAKDAGYTVQIIHTEAVILQGGQAKSVHNVPDDVMKRMKVEPFRDSQIKA